MRETARSDRVRQWRRRYSRSRLAGRGGRRAERTAVSWRTPSRARLLDAFGDSGRVVLWLDLPTTVQPGGRRRQLRLAARPVRTPRRLALSESEALQVCFRACERACW